MPLLISLWGGGIFCHITTVAKDDQDFQTEEKLSILEKTVFCSVELPFGLLSKDSVSRSCKDTWKMLDEGHVELLFGHLSISQNLAQILVFENADS